MARNQTNLKEDEYEFPIFVYYKEVDARVPLVIIGVGTLLRLQGPWNDDDNETLKVMIESCKGIDDKLVPNVEGSPQYYHKGNH